MDNNALKEQYTNLAKAASSALNSYVYDTIDAAANAKNKFEDIIISGNSLDDGVLSECRTLLYDIADELKVIIDSCDAKITSIVQEQTSENNNSDEDNADTGESNNSPPNGRTVVKKGSGSKDSGFRRVAGVE